MGETDAAGRYINEIKQQLMTDPRLNDSLYDLLELMVDVLWEMAPLAVTGGLHEEEYVGHKAMEGVLEHCARHALAEFVREQNRQRGGS
jgi:hypothetical protein